jgi:cytochrome c heme-lyase
LHNYINEITWMKILQWERLHCYECQAPTLTSFTGRPNDISPKAWLRSCVLGEEKPFDRHDWIVDRCGTSVRYVIDYYNGSGDSGAAGVDIDARPALDSVQAVIDRSAVAVGDVVMHVQSSITNLFNRDK